MSPSDILKQRLEHFRSQSPSVSACADRLRELGYKVCTLEDLAEGNTITARRPIERRDITLEQLLDEIVAQNPGYRWEEAKDNLINIFPIQSILDTKVPRLNIDEKGVWRILKEDIEIENKGVSLFIEFGEDNGPLINLRLESADLREALNAIVGQLGQAVWHISGNPGAYLLTILSVPDDRKPSSTTQAR